MLKCKTFKFIASLLSLFLFIYLAATAYLYFSQEKLLFPATKLAPDYKFEFDVPFEEKTIMVKGAELNALHFKQASPQGIVFFLHGNSGNLKTWATNLKYYQQINYDMFIFDYRGYGKSTGIIESQEQLLNDVTRAWYSIADEYKNKKTVIFGRSLGTALATKLAIDVKPDLLVLVAPFTSIVDMAYAQYPFLPRVNGLIRYPLNTHEWIQEVTCKTLFVHGNDDQFIPMQHSEQLQQLSRSENKLIIIDKAGHGNIQDFDEYHERLTLELP